MGRVCYFHAGCPDGFGAAWAVWQAWGDDARYVGRNHQDEIRAQDHEGDYVAYVDIAPRNEELAAVTRVADRVTLLDHHITAQRRYEGDFELVNAIEALGHEIVFDMEHSGAVLAWNWFVQKPLPDLLRYVEDQDLWSWKLPSSEEVNAAIAAYPRRFDVWDELAKRPADALAREGEPIVRANRIETERALLAAHPLRLGDDNIEAVNATHGRSAIGHRLSERHLYDRPWGCVYRIIGDQVHATLYSIGDLDVAERAAQYRGGGHRNAAGFTVPLDRWLREFV